MTPAATPPSNPQFIAVNGVVDQIAALLTVHGGTGKNTLNVDDSGDMNDNTGQLTVTDVTGLDMAGSIHYDGFADDINIVLGHGNDVFTIVSTHTGLTTVEGRSGNDQINVKTISGETRVAGDGFFPTLTYGSNTICTGIAGTNVACGALGGDDLVDVGTLAGDGGDNFNGNLQGIGAALIVQGGGQNDVDRLVADDSGDATGRTGLLTSTDITGLGMAAAGIHYTQIEALHLMLGLGNDAFHIDSTHAGTTRVNGGPGNDTITVNSIQGGTQIEGDDPVLPATETFSLVDQRLRPVLQILDSLTADHRALRRERPLALRRRLHARRGRQVRSLRRIRTRPASSRSTYNAPVTNRGHAINYTRGPPLSSTLTYDDTILVNVTQARAN